MNLLGVSKFCQVHEFIGDMFGQKVQFKVTSVTGHIYIADFTPEYQDWRLVNPLSLFEATTIKKETNAEVKLFSRGIIILNFRYLEQNN